MKITDYTKITIGYFGLTGLTHQITAKLQTPQSILMMQILSMWVTGFNAG